MSFGLEVWNGGRLFRIDGSTELLTIKDRFTVTVGRTTRGVIRVSRPSVKSTDKACVLPYEYISNYNDLRPSGGGSIVPKVVRAMIVKSGEVEIHHSEVWPEDKNYPPKGGGVYEIMVFEGI